MMKRTILIIVLTCVSHSLLIIFHCPIPSASAQEYKMAGPFAVIARDGQYRDTKAGSERDMKAAWNFAKEGAYDKACHIVNEYAEKLQRLDGHDAPLCLIQGYWLCRAMMELKENCSRTMNDLSPLPTEAWESMLRRAMVPTMNKFEAYSPYANGNWGAIVNRFRMACALAIGDSAMYKAAVDYYLHGYDNGSLPCYISETGQCQETGRDQSHTQLGLGALCDICEMAWQRGDDLWGALDNRLMKGIEYSARYNLGYNVPFETWTDCTGLYCNWTEPSEMGRGKVWDIYEQPYNHYVKRLGLKMPYTKRIQALKQNALKKGKLLSTLESQTFMVPGVTERKNLHQTFTYRAPQGAPLTNDYDVYVQPRGSKKWEKIDTYIAKVNASIGNNKHQVSQISYCFFDFTGDVFVRVVSKNKKIRTAQIRPVYRGTIASVQNDSTIQFQLFQPENLSVELDGDITSNLLIFTSKPPISKEEAELKAKSEGRTFVYFPPGYYDNNTSQFPSNMKNIELQSDTIYISSNTTVYLAGGSYFTSTFAINDAAHVSILGRGVARPPRGYEGAHIYRSTNVLIDGLIVNTCPIGGSDGVTLHDIRSISHPGWGDGLNVFASQNVLFDRVFCRNSDDCTTAYATRKGFSGNCRNIHMRNSTLWADLAHPIFIGIHGNPEVGDTIEHLVYENIDILGQAEPQVDYQGCLAINCGDGNLVRDVLFDNIRIEQIEIGSIAQVKVGYNQKYCTAPGKGIENITFKNVRYNCHFPISSTDSNREIFPNRKISGSGLSIIAGYDKEHPVRNIVFENLRINGQIIHDDMSSKPLWHSAADYIPMYIGNHVNGIVFKKTPCTITDDEQDRIRRSKGENER